MDGDGLALDGGGAGELMAMFGCVAGFWCNNDCELCECAIVCELRGVSGAKA